MVMLLDRFLPRTEFTSYEDFCENFKINVPENFNFAFDVVDAIAVEDPEKERHGLVRSQGRSQVQFC